MSCIAKILTIVTIVFTLLPCSDGSLENQYNGITQITLNTDDTSNHYSDDDDLCTPFCNCVCCGNLVYSVKTINVTQLESVDIELNQYYTSNLMSDFISNNFQPPRV